MSTAPFGFGIIGPGMIAGVVANALDQSPNARLVAVSSRRLEQARQFVAARAGVVAVEGIEALLAHAEVEAVYVATPTVAKEPLALAAIAAGKHVLVDKPFADEPSARRMIEAAAAKGILFMDATHFVHHPRTAAIRRAIPQQIGVPRSLHTNFYYPHSDRTNIRFQPNQEPMTALGDMGWYSMRAVVEYLQPVGAATHALTIPERDAETGAIVRASGLIAFASGEVSTFDIGFTAGTSIMSLQLLGTTGAIEMDDFVLDWCNSFGYHDPDQPAGYFHRTGLATRKDVVHIPSPSELAQEVAMLEDFVRLARNGEPEERHRQTEATLKTQAYLDAIFAAVEG